MLKKKCYPSPGQHTPGTTDKLALQVSAEEVAQYKEGFA